MKSKDVRLIAAAFKESQSCNAHKQKATGMIAARRAQGQMQNFAFRFAHPNANAAELPDLDVQTDTNAD